MTIAHMIDRRLADMADTGKPLRRSTAADPDLLRRKVGVVRIRDMDRAALSPRDGSAASGLLAPSRSRPTPPI